MFVPSLLLAAAGAVAYPVLIAYVERRYERLILVDLTVLETRFEGITRATPPRPRLIAASALAEARRGVGAADGDLEVQVRAGREAGRADAADARAGATRGAEGDGRAARGARSGSSCRAVVEDDGQAPAVVVAGEGDAAGARPR